MALLDKFPTSKQQPCDPRTSNDAEDREKHPAENSDNDSDIVNPNFQYGVRNAQASLKVWTRNQLIAAYVLYVADFPCIAMMYAADIST